MTATLSHISDSSTWQADTGAAAPSNDDAWLAWPVHVEGSGGTEHTLLLDHTQGDSAPARKDVEAHIEGLPEDHDLHGARLAYHITKRAFLDSFTASEIRDVRDADRAVGDWSQAQRTAAGGALTYVENVNTIDLRDDKTIQLVEALESAGLIDAGRADEILDR